MLVGAGVAANGVNCAMLGVSGAEAIITSTDASEQGDVPWTAEAIDGDVTVGSAGVCL